MCEVFFSARIINHDIGNISSVSKVKKFNTLKFNQKIICNRFNFLITAVFYLFLNSFADFLSLY